MFAKGNQLGLKHGHNRVGKRSPTYSTWHKMMQRCNNPNNEKFKHYGGRGIKVCTYWWSFEAFLASMGERPEGLTLDRIDNNGNYEPSNCKWSTQAQQIQNSSSAKLGWGEVRAIRELHRRKCPVTVKRLAEWFRISVSAVYHILQGRSWKEVRI